MILRSVRVGRDQIGFMRWLLESHDGLATPTTRAGTDDIIDFLVAPDFADEFDALLEAVRDELKLVEIEAPESPPLGG